MQTIEGPFGSAKLIEKVPPSVIEKMYMEMYMEKCRAEVDFSAAGIGELELL